MDDKSKSLKEGQVWTGPGGRQYQVLDVKEHKATVANKIGNRFGNVHTRFHKDNDGWELVK